MGEKGSIKNLYKSWRIFLEEQKKKKKKTSKVKVFAVTFFTFLLSPFFFSSKEYKKSVKQIDLLISEIDKEENPEILNELKNILKKEKDKVLETELKDSKKNKKIKLIEKAENKIETKLEKITEEIKNKEIIKTEEKNNQITNSESNEKIKVDEQTIEINSIMIPINEFEETKVIQKQASIIKDPDVLEFLNYMKLEINTIEYKLKGDLNLFQLKYIKIRITELNNKRDNFKSNYDFKSIKKLYENKDKYKILESNEKLESLYKICETKLEELNNQKEEKNEKKTKKIKQENINLEEIKKINEYLDKQIKKQDLEISKLKLIISKTEKKLKRGTILSNIKNMLGNTMKICLGLLPLSIFKNKLVAGLVSSFMLNNSVRGIRNLINEEKIEYAKLLSNINNQKDLIFHTRLVYEDALTQIEFLKYDLLSRFSFTDLKDIFHKLYEIGEELKKKNKMLSDLEIELEEQYDKTREKVKRYAA